MKIGLISSSVPLVRGGGRFIVDWLADKLMQRGYEVEIIYIPFVDNPDEILLQMNAFRTMNLEPYFDRVITFRPPAHVVRHSRKVVWFIHHIRMFYDLWDTSYRAMPDIARWRSLRQTLIQADTTGLEEAHRVFANSHTVRSRLYQYNGITCDVLYPPILNPALFRSESYNDEIVSVCRMEHHKRQHLLIEAMQYVRTPVRLRLSGLAQDPDYRQQLRDLVKSRNLQDKVSIEERWISEQEKADRLAGALANVYAPVDEDSYGYPTIEAAHANRCTITTTDAGGVPEFVKDGVHGLVVEPIPYMIASAFDSLYEDRQRAEQMGRKSAARVSELGIDWDVVIGKLLS